MYGTAIEFELNLSTQAIQNKDNEAICMAQRLELS
jgi:hypothetical protein